MMYELAGLRSLGIVCLDNASARVDRKTQQHVDT